MNSLRNLFWLMLTLAASAVPLRASSSPSITVTSFAAGVWPRTDTALGITGYTIETFESTTLVSGLLIGWNTTAQNVTPAATIPNRFDATVADPHGSVFVNGQWDGSYGLLNTWNNQTFSYTSAATNWGSIVINFSTPVSSLGFSLHQNELDVGLVVNGSTMSSLQTYSGFTPSGGRFGYFRIDATGGTQITSIELTTGGNDGILIDHLAFAAIPEPAHGAVLLALGAIAALARRRRLT